MELKQKQEINNLVRRRINALRTCLNYAFHRAARHRSGITGYVKLEDINYWRDKLKGNVDV